MEPQRTLTDLPFEVLDLIFKALANKPARPYDYSNDKLSLAEASEYLGQAFAYHSRDAYARAFSKYDVPERAWQVILSLCGSKTLLYIGTVISGWNLPLAKAVAQYCPNLQTVCFEVNADNADILLSVIDNAKSSIGTLTCRYCLKAYPRGGGNIMHKIPELPLLTKLTIAHCLVNEAYQIQRFLNIEELFLKLPHCYRAKDLESLNLFKVCAPLKKLRLLTAIGINIISETHEAETISPFPVLEHFALTFCDISMEFPTCSNLKTLNMINCWCHIKGLLCRSVLKQGENLKRLVVECKPSQFDNDGFLEVIRKFKKLRNFIVPVRKLEFHQEFVNEAQKALRENGINKTDPLALTLMDDICNNVNIYRTHYATGSRLLQGPT